MKSHIACLLLGLALLLGAARGLMARWPPHAGSIWPSSDLITIVSPAPNTVATSEARSLVQASGGGGNTGAGAAAGAQAGAKGSGDAGVSGGWRQLDDSTLCSSPEPSLICSMYQTEMYDSVYQRSLVCIRLIIQHLKVQHTSAWFDMLRRLPTSTCSTCLRSRVRQEPPSAPSPRPPPQAGTRLQPDRCGCVVAG